MLESVPFQALDCEGGALINICLSKALILRSILVRHLLGGSTKVCYLLSLLMVVLAYPLIHTFGAYCPCS